MGAGIVRVEDLYASPAAAITRTVERAAEIRAQLTEISRAHALSQKLGASRTRVQVSETLIIREEEEFVFDDGPAQGQRQTRCSGTPA